MNKQEFERKAHKVADKVIEIHEFEYEIKWEWFMKGAKWAWAELDNDKWLDRAVVESIVKLREDISWEQENCKLWIEKYDALMAELKRIKGEQNETK